MLRNPQRRRLRSCSRSIPPSPLLKRRNNRIKPQRDEILNLQSKIAELVASCNTALAQIDALQQMAVGGIFTPENPPIWNADLWARAKTTLPERLPKIAASYWGDILLYVRDPSRHMPRHVAIFIALSLVLLAARRQVGQGEAAGDRPSHATAVFDHVFAAALLVTLMVATAPTSPVPVTVKRFFKSPHLCQSSCSPGARCHLLSFPRSTRWEFCSPPIPCGGQSSVSPLWVRGYWCWRPSQGLLCWVGCWFTEPVGRREVWAKRAICGGCWLLLFYSPWPSD